MANLLTFPSFIDRIKKKIEKIFKVFKVHQTNDSNGDYTHLPTFHDRFVHFLQEVHLPAAFRVANSRRVCRFRDEEVRATFVDPSGTQMSIRRHVVVS